MPIIRVPVPVPKTLLAAAGLVAAAAAFPNQCSYCNRWMAGSWFSRHTDTCVEYGNHADQWGWPVAGVVRKPRTPMTGVTPRPE